MTNSAPTKETTLILLFLLGILLAFFLNPYYFLPLFLLWLPCVHACVCRNGGAWTQPGWKRAVPVTVGETQTFKP